MTPSTYHLVWTTYGTWLSGDARGWIKKSTVGVQPPNPRLEMLSRQRMAEDVVVLTDVQRAIVEQTVRDHCRIRGWTIHALNVRSNHVHIVVSAHRNPDDVMSQLKAWCSRKLSDDAGLSEPVAVRAGRWRWFTEGGDREIVGDDDYFHNAVRYVVERQ